MGWEERKNGRRYYYHKRRNGMQVVSDYVGRGIQADCVAHLDQQERENKQAQWKAYHLEIVKLLAIDKETKNQYEFINALAVAALLISGYHTHKGQWRRRKK